MDADLCAKVLEKVVSNRYWDEELCWRLASLADGEGSFNIGSIRNRHGNAQYNCSFTVKMRADDAPFLRRMAEWTGLGSLYEHDAVTADGHNRKPQVSWKVQTKGDCLALALIFDNYPLWSKKQRDYEVWREAVHEWCSRSTGDSWQPFKHLAFKIKQVRQYDPALA